MAFPGLIEGRIVHYVLEDGPSRGEHRPAIVVHVWRTNGAAQDNGLCQLLVFLDGTNDDPDPEGGYLTVWKTSRTFSDQEKKPGTWHWIEQA